VRRNWLYRSFAGIMSVWLAICLVEPAQLHTCAMHGGLAIEGGVHSAGVHSPRAHAAHAAPAAHRGIHGSDATPTGSRQDQDSDTQSKHCSCLGDCSVGKTAISLPGSSTQLQQLAISASASAFPRDVPAVSAPHFLLPFANGPPAFSSRA